MPLYIESSKNPKVKWLLQLQQKTKLRRSEGVVLVEGRKEYQLALKAGWTPKIAIHSGDYEGDIPNESEEWVITTDLAKTLFVRGERGEILGVFEQPSDSLEELDLPDNALVIVMEAVEKPGTLGAVLRTADAAGVDAVFVVDSVGDIFHPNVARNSLGALCSVPIVSTSSQEAFDYLNERGFSTVVTWLEASVPYTTLDYSGPTAIVVGAEATGVTPFWVENGAQRAIIPMAGVVDSMNVSVATAIVVFEAVRQRNL
jgi:TrmH family RNA methyltransferase